MTVSGSDEVSEVTEVKIGCTPPRHLSHRYSLGSQYVVIDADIKELFLRLLREDNSKDLFRR